MTGIDYYFQFQFLIGRLKTQRKFEVKFDSKTFQFLIGRLKTDPALQAGDYINRFNSL